MKRRGRETEAPPSGGEHGGFPPPERIAFIRAGTSCAKIRTGSDTALDAPNAFLLLLLYLHMAPKTPKLYEEGVVIENLPNALFRVDVAEGRTILGHLSGKMRINHIKVLLGDRVKVEMSPYDNTKGRIVLRMK